MTNSNKSTIQWRLLFVSMLLLVFANGLITQAQQLTTRSVSKEYALAKVKNLYPNADYDYYVVDPATNPSYTSSNWTFFVDADPMKGWEHNCYIVTVPKSVYAFEEPVASPTLKKLPPTGTLEPIDVKDRFGKSSLKVPMTSSNNGASVSNPYASKTYVVILSGGINQNSNHERYWNDCSFIYQTVTKRYDVPKDQIYVLMADGTDPAPDMHTLNHTYVSSPLDLDFDGTPDIKYSASRANVRSVLNTLATKVTATDHVFLFVIDHGGSNDGINSSYICLWNFEKLQDTELGSWIQPILNKGAHFSAVLGQCNSGGFIEELDRRGCVVATACRGDESSWACSGIPYDEFVYQWTSAMNGMTPYGEVVYVEDYDYDNITSMFEAYNYALDNDRVYKEHPLYSSNPYSVGNDLAFNFIPKAYDLYIKDNLEDTGKEPNNSTEKFWDSPSIWVRNQDDNIKSHENPYYSSDHLSCIIYVQIDNKGKDDYPGGKWLHTYWAKASTGLSKKAWKGRELYRNSMVTGEHLRAVSIPPIPSGGSVILKVNWSLPIDFMTDLDDNSENDHHFCILGRIMDTHLDDGYNPSEGNRYFDIQKDNDLAQKNVSIIYGQSSKKKTSVFVRNLNTTETSYNIEVIPRSSNSIKLFSGSNLSIQMSNKIFNGWEKGGKKLIGMKYDQNEMPKEVKVTSPGNQLTKVVLGPDEFDAIALNTIFTPATLSTKSERYEIDVVQKELGGKIVGGETFIIYSPGLISTPLTIRAKDNKEDMGYTLSVPEEFEEKNISWYKNNNHIGEGRNISVLPDSKEDVYQALVSFSDEEAALGEISLNPRKVIESIAVNPGGTSLSIAISEYLDMAEIAFEITCLSSSIPNGATIVLPEESSENKIKLNISNLPSGLYAVSIKQNGIAIASAKFSK